MNFENELFLSFFLHWTGEVALFPLRHAGCFSSTTWCLFSSTIDDWLFFLLPGWTAVSEHNQYCIFIFTKYMCLGWKCKGKTEKHKGRWRPLILPERDHLKTLLLSQKQGVCYYWGFLLPVSFDQSEWVYRVDCCVFAPALQSVISYRPEWSIYLCAFMGILIFLSLRSLVQG